MSDLYNIPNDDGKTFRLKKFVEYQHEVPYVDSRFVGEYAIQEKVTPSQAVKLCWLDSVAYNEVTAVLLHEMLKTMRASEVWEKYRDDLVFNSSRRYVKNNNKFTAIMDSFYTKTRGNPIGWVKTRESHIACETYRSLTVAAEQIYYTGRFAADTFLEALDCVKEYIGLNMEQDERLDWDDCSNLTSGIFNIFYEDEKAELFDRGCGLTKGDKAYLSERLLEIQKAVQDTYPDQDSRIIVFIGKICSFRNLFKGARYAGFHHDRELECIRHYESAFPQYQYLWDKCYDLRKRIFPNRFLGELHGWNGIRKERKRLWLDYGRTGAESEVR